MRTRVSSPAMSKKGYFGPPAKKVDKVDLRLPDGLRDRVAAQADKDRRSTNSQIVHYIEMGLSGLDAISIAQAILRLDAAVAQIEQKPTEK